MSRAELRVGFCQAEANPPVGPGRLMKPRPITNRHEARASFAPYSISRWYNSSAKRAFDLVGAICLFVVCFPVMVLVAVGVKLTSPGPVIFRQRRPGRQGRQFNYLKVRTMWDGGRKPRPGLTPAEAPRGPAC